MDSLYRKLNSRRPFQLSREPTDRPTTRAPPFNSPDIALVSLEADSINSRVANRPELDEHPRDGEFATLLIGAFNPRNKNDSTTT